MPNDTDSADMVSQLLALGAQADSERELESDDSSTANETESPSVPATSDKPSEPGEAKVQPPVPGETKPEQSADIAANKAKESEQKPLSRYEKAKAKAAEDWKAIEADKQARAEARAKIEAEDQKHRQPPSKIEGDIDHRGVFRDKYGSSQQQYESYISNPESDPEQVEIAKFCLESLKQEEAKYHQKQFDDEWTGYVDEAAKELPDVKNIASPIGLKIQEVLKEAPVYGSHPLGIKHAIELAKYRLNGSGDAATVSALKAKVEELTKEKERLVKVTSISGSGPARGGGESPKDDFKSLQRMAAEMDGEAA